MNPLFKVMTKGVLVGLVLSFAAFYAQPALGDPLHTRVVLLTVAFDNKTGEVVRYWINGFADKDSCVGGALGIAAIASQQLDATAHVGQSLCFGDVTVYNGKAPAVPLRQPAAPKAAPQPGYKGPVTQF